MNTNNYGSFKVNIDCVDPQRDNFLESKDITIESQSFLVKPLSQKLLADGWSLVVPKPKFKYKEFITQSGENIRRRKYLNNYFKINLAQLPDELWTKIIPVYEEKKYSHSTAKNRRYIYIINSTPVDAEIRELRNIIVNNFAKNNKDRIKELLQVLDDNGINGWVIIRARSILGEDL